MGLAALLWLSGAGTSAAAAEEEVRDIEELSLEALLDTEVQVASKSARELRESPGIVTVLTREDIVRSGARDLVELLGFVPGLFFGIDTSNVLGPSVRGNWAEDGKVLLLLDGSAMNERLYSAPHFGLNVPLALVERIEVVRGPGSAIYGGEAELAVINVVTARGPGQRGVLLEGTLGAGPSAVNRAGVTGSYVDAFPALGGLEVSVAMHVDRALRGDGIYRDQSGSEVELAESSAVTPLFLQAAAKLGGLSVRLVAQHIDVENRDSYSEVLPRAMHLGFTGYSGEVRLALEPTAGLVITPRLRLLRQLPWRSVDHTFPDVFYDKTVDRAEASLDASWSPCPELDVLGGAVLLRDHAALGALEELGFQTRFDGEDAVTDVTLAAYGQVEWQTPIVDLALGARFESHDRFDDTFVPRLALTKVFGDLHFKALASKAFRAPGLESVNLNPDISPEDTTAFEVEVGYKLADLLFLSANVFDLTIDRAITYAYDPARGAENYLNGESTGSRGFEVEARLRHGGLSVDASYSFYTATDKNRTPSYAVPGDPAVMLGAPAHKLALRGAFTPYPGVVVSPSLLLASERSAWVARDAQGRAVLGTVPFAAVLGVFAEWKRAFVDEVDVGLGLYDLLDRRIVWVQPYDGGHAPHPSTGREVMLRVTLHEPLP